MDVGVDRDRVVSPHEFERVGVVVGGRAGEGRETRGSGVARDVRVHAVDVGVRAVGLRGGP